MVVSYDLEKGPTAYDVQMAHASADIEICYTFCHQQADTLLSKFRVKNKVTFTPDKAVNKIQVVRYLH
jgi:hypothetical protein